MQKPILRKPQPTIATFLLFIAIDISSWSFQLLLSFRYLSANDLFKIWRRVFADRTYIILRQHFPDILISTNLAAPHSLTILSLSDCFRLRLDLPLDNIHRLQMDPCSKHPYPWSLRWTSYGSRVTIWSTFARNICICALCHIINSIFATPAGFVSLKLVHIPAGLKRPNR